VLLEKFLDGMAVLEGDGNRWINQIHRDDAARALLVLLAARERGIYNVADDDPMTQRECYEWLAEHFNKPMPPGAPVDLARKRGWTSKRVGNAKLRALGWRCGYASFKEAVSRGGVERRSGWEKVSPRGRRNAGGQ
jgi:nucleoside-diphosphate-sugar epimerase